MAGFSRQLSRLIADMFAQAVGESLMLCGGKSWFIFFSK